MTYIYPHGIWTRMCIPVFFDYDSMPTTFCYTYFKGLSNIRLGFGYIYMYADISMDLKLEYVQLLPFPFSNFPNADLNVW